LGAEPVIVAAGAIVGADERHGLGGSEGEVIEIGEVGEPGGVRFGGRRARRATSGEGEGEEQRAEGGEQGAESGAQNAEGGAQSVESRERRAEKG
jgi:hypothetical protein